MVGLNMKNLMTLNLKGASVTNYELMNITEDIKLLRHINLEGCKFITDGGFNTLTEINQSLETIILKNTNIIDAGVRRVLQNCKRLIRLDLSRCYYISNDSVTQIKEHCPYLSYLCFDHDSMYRATDSPVGCQFIGPMCVNVENSGCLQVCGIWSTMMNFELHAQNKLTPIIHVSV